MRRKYEGPLDLKSARPALLTTTKDLWPVELAWLAAWAKECNRMYQTLRRRDVGRAERFREYYHLIRTVLDWRSTRKSADLMARVAEGVREAVDYRMRELGLDGEHDHKCEDGERLRFRGERIVEAVALRGTMGETRIAVNAAVAAFGRGAEREKAAREIWLMTDVSDERARYYLELAAPARMEGYMYAVARMRRSVEAAGREQWEALDGEQGPTRRV